MNRKDVIAARNLATRFVELSDEILEAPYRRWDHRNERYLDGVWTETWQITGRLTGAHRRASLDLTRALAHMRRRP